MRLSFDNNQLFTVGKDGCLIIHDVKDRDPKNKGKWAAIDWQMNFWTKKNQHTLGYLTPQWDGKKGSVLVAWPLPAADDPKGIVWVRSSHHIGGPGPDGAPRYGLIYAPYKARYD